MLAIEPHRSAREPVLWRTQVLRPGRQPGMDGRDVVDVTCHTIQAPVGMSAEDWAGIVGALRPLEGSAGPLSAATVYEASDLE
eukprot:14976-Alexandrium_andersonii.AAC.1